MRKHHVIMLAVCMAVVMRVIGPALAEEAAVTEPDGAIHALSPIVVTPTRFEQESAALPFAVSEYTAEDIQVRKMSRTTPEILDDVPSVMVQKTGHGQGSPFIRGFTGFRTLFLIDGIRLNNSVFRDGPNQYWNTVDPLSIDELELIRGPASVMYGSDAIGGTANALTYSPLDEGEPGYGGRAYYRYSSAEASHIVRGEAQGVEEGKAAFMAGANYKHFGELKTGGDSGRLPKTGYDEYDLDAKIQYMLSPSVRLTLAHQMVEQNDAWRTHKTIYGESFHGTTVGNEKKRSLDQERRLTYARLDGGDLPSFINDASLTLSLHNQKETRDRIKKDDTGDKQGFDVNTIGALLQLHSSTEAGEFVYGVEYYRDFVDSFKRKYKADGSLKSVGIQGPVADDSTYDMAGLYVEDTLAVVRQLDLILGARYNYIAADAGEYENPNTGEADSFSKNWDALTAGAHLLYRVLPEAGVNVYAGVSQAFRAPNLSDLTRFDTARTDEIETPSPDLDPENFVAFEGGVKMVREALYLDAAYYYTMIDDLIVRTPTGRTIDGDNEVTKKNSGNGYVQGVEFSGAWMFVADWTLWGNVSWMDGEVDTYPTSAPEKKREPLDRLMPLTGNAGLKFEPSERYWVEAVMKAAARADRLSTRDKSDTDRIPEGGTPGYAVFSVRGGYRITEDIEVSVEVANLANKDYRVHGSGVNEPGRNLIVAVDCAF